MHAVYVSQASPDDPLAALEVGPRPNPQAGDGFSRVWVKAASLNHHDVWSLRGVGLPPERMPMILGTDAAGVKHYDNLVKPELVAPGNKLIGAEADDNHLVESDPSLEAQVSDDSHHKHMVLSGTSMASW